MVFRVMELTVLPPLQAEAFSVEVAQVQPTQLPAESAVCSLGATARPETRVVVPPSLPSAGWELVQERTGTALKLPVLAPLAQVCWPPPVRQASVLTPLLQVLEPPSAAQRMVPGALVF